MLTIFRRHVKECKWKSRKHRNCQCPLAVEGTLHGRTIRKSLDLRSWEAAQKLVREWEANPEGGAVTVNDACDKFMADAIARNLSEAMVRKLRNVTDELKANLVVKFEDIEERLDKLEGKKRNRKRSKSRVCIACVTPAFLAF